MAKGVEGLIKSFEVKGGKSAAVPGKSVTWKLLGEAIIRKTKKGSFRNVLIKSTPCANQ